MTDLSPPFRSATLEDAGALAELVNFAGEGLPLYLWDRLKKTGETAWDVGRQRAARDEGSFSYRNAVVADVGGECVGCLIGYSQPDSPEPIDYGSMPPMFVPLQELENLAPATWYVNVLAVYPDYRGHGFGTGLLGIADRIAEEKGLRGLSVIVADNNDGARQLYARCGYREAGARPMVKEGWDGTGRNWLLMAKDF